MVFAAKLFNKVVRMHLRGSGDSDSLIRLTTQQGVHKEVRIHDPALRIGDGDSFTETNGYVKLGI